MSLRLLSGQASYLSARGFLVDVVTAPGNDLTVFAANEPVRPHVVSMERRVTPFRDLVAIYRLVRLMRRVRPTIVHAHTPKGGLLGMISAWIARVPVRVYHLRGLPFVTRRGVMRQVLRFTERIACRLAHRVICLGPTLRTAAVREGLCTPQKIRILAGGSGNGVDAVHRFCPDRVGLTARDRVRAAHGIPADARVIGYVGRVVRDKGVAELVAAWRRLREEYLDAHLLLVGPFEPEDPLPQMVVDALRCDPRVHLTGMQRDTPPYYAAMDILVLPTHREGFGNVLLEAAAMRLPSVATSDTGCVDAVVDGLTGTLFPSGDVTALTNAIGRYLCSAELRLAHGAAGRERVLREFEQEAIWKALFEEYQVLLGSVGASQSEGQGGRVRVCDTSVRAGGR